MAGVDAHIMKQDFENVVRLIADRMRKGENVIVGDITHSDTNVLRYVAHPWALKQYHDAGMTDLLLEIPQQDYNLLKSLQGRGLSREDINSAISKHKILSATLPEKDGTKAEWLSGLADITYYTDQFKIKLHYDPSTEAGEKYAMGKLPENERELLQKFWDDRNAGRRTEDSMTSAEKGAFDIYLKSRHEYRSAKNSNDASPSDTAVVNGMKERGVGAGPVLGFFGVGHLLGRNDLDELLTEVNSRPTKVIMPYMPEHNGIIQNAIDAKVGKIDVPDYFNNPRTAELRETPKKPDDIANARTIAQWFNDATSVNISNLGTLPPSFSINSDISASSVRQR